MQVRDITEKDAKAATQLAQFVQFSIRLLDALRLAGIPVTGPGIVEREQNALWLGQLLKDMASAVSTPVAIPVPKKQSPRTKIKTGKT